MLTSWEIKSYDYTAYEDLIKKLDISPALVKLLTQRGVYTYKEAQKFLNGSLQDLASPYVLSNMDKAVARIKKALDNKERVVIYGDYDVDGVCSTVIILDCLKKIGLEANYYVPDRFSEGYGLNAEAIRDLAKQGYNLVISVDCGITSVTEVELAKELGLDLIITDHHTPSEELPPAQAIINPKLDEDIDSFNLCGAGVAFKLAWALSEDILTQEQIFAWLDLVALATVADIVPLWGDNRIMVKYGLKQIERTTRPGLKALLSIADLDSKIISTWHIGFILAPRLNAAGRMESACLSIELLQSDNYTESIKLANHLNELNNKRKSVEEQILKEATLYIESHVDLETETILVVDGDEWHHGVIGIVASRLTEKYNRPVVLISWEGDEGRGSARSVDDFDLYKALSACQEYLIQFGGHKLAAGLSIKKEQLASFKSALLSYGVKLTDDSTYYKRRVIDLELNADEVNNSFLEELKLLEPFGEGNPNPCFVWRGIEVIDPALVGKNQDHFKFKILPGYLDAIAFGKPEYFDNPFSLLKYDIVFNLDENEFLGKKSIQLKVTNLKPTVLPDNPSFLTNSLKKPQDVFNIIIRELGQKRPVILVYPTYRTLSKHYLTLKDMFNPKLITRLHGRLYIEDRSKSQSLLEKGNVGIYLITKAYLEYYLQNKSLPDNLRHIIDIWPNLTANSFGFDNMLIDNLLEPRKMRIKKEEIDISQTKRAVVYANRSSTVKKLANQFENLVVTAGQVDYHKRNTLRRQFLARDRGVMLLDGAYDFYGNDIAGIDVIHLADVPFSYYESMLVMNQISATEDVELVTLFADNDIESNKQFLIRNYPDIDTVKKVLTYFKSLKTSLIQGDFNELNNKVASFIHKDNDNFNLLPVLWILADLGLCKVKKKANIIEINFTKVSNLVLDISNSPYYLEGLVEKRAFIDWEQMLTND